MPTITEPITFNARDRGRSANGQDRNFDCAALAAVINGAQVQEQVKHGDLFGYFGHWPRLKFGMNPQEGGIVDGKVVSIAPALRTVELSADDEGNVTHRAEFLPTEGGQKAESMYLAKAGGFSWAITPVKGTNPIIPKSFFGFDYVKEPNFTFNRGYQLILDSVGSEDELMDIMDAVVSDFAAGESIMRGLFDGLHAQHLRTLEAYERAVNENQDLIGMLARKRAGSPILDSVGEIDGIPPLRGPRPEDFERFRNVALVSLQDLPRPKDKGDNSPEAGYLRAKFGMR